MRMGSHGVTLEVKEVKKGVKLKLIASLFLVICIEVNGLSESDKWMINYPDCLLAAMLLSAVA